MKNSNNPTIEELIKYVRNECSAEQKAHIDSLLKNDTDLQQVVAGLLDFQQNEKQSIEAFVASLPQTKSSKKTRTKYLYMAASIAAILVMGLFLFYPNQTNYNNFQITDAGLPLTLSTHNTSTLASAMNLYKTKNYKKSIADFSELLNQSPSNDTLLYYLGAANTELGNYTNAINYFNEVPQHSAFLAKTQYHLAYCYAQTKQTNKAVQLLEKIAADSTHIYQQQAKQFLLTLKS